MLDADLAELYWVSTKALNQAVKRNKGRFPSDFMFQLNQKEFNILKSQVVTSSQWGGRRIPPYVFTEQGVAMLSSVLNSERAIQVNIEIMRAFVRLREIVATHKGLARKLEALEKKYDSQFKVVFDAIRTTLPMAHWWLRLVSTTARKKKLGEKVLPMMVPGGGRDRLRAVREIGRRTRQRLSARKFLTS